LGIAQYSQAYFIEQEKSMKEGIKKHQLYIFITLIIVFIFVLYMKNQMSSKTPAHNTESIIAIWEKQAKEHGLSNEVKQKVSELYGQIVEHDMVEQKYAEDVTNSIDRYLSQYINNFINDNSCDGAILCMAWLLVNCTHNQYLSNEDFGNIKKWFDEFKPKIISAVNENINKTLGPDGFIKYQEQIKQIDDWIIVVLDHYYNELHSDPLFPLFKMPLDEDVEEKVLNEFKNSSSFSFKIKTERQLMVTEEEHIVEQMEDSYDQIPKEVILFCIAHCRDRLWEKEGYWGGLLHNFRTISRPGEGDWPINMLFKKKKYHN